MNGIVNRKDLVAPILLICFLFTFNETVATETQNCSVQQNVREETARVVNALLFNLGYHLPKDEEVRGKDVDVVFSESDSVETYVQTSMKSTAVVKWINLNPPEKKVNAQELYKAFFYMNLAREQLEGVHFSQQIYDDLLVEFSSQNLEIVFCKD